MIAAGSYGIGSFSRENGDICTVGTTDGPLDYNMQGILYPICEAYIILSKRKSKEDVKTIWPSSAVDNSAGNRLDILTQNPTRFGYK